MKLAIPDGDGGFYTFTNENLKVGDEVFPLVNGWSHNGEWYLTDVVIHHDTSAFHALALTGWPDEYHLIVQIVKSKNEPLRIYTNRGYSPAECYFKLIEHVPSSIPSRVECSECRFDETCKIKKDKKVGGGCSFHGRKK